MRYSAPLLAALLLAAPAAAQDMDLPQPSPKASVMQRVGLTDITVDYSSPGVKKRTIWGGLVPFNELWRTGANSATRITFSREVTVGGKAVPAGTYSILTLPGPKTWQVILNKKLDLWNTQGYAKKDDVARITVTPAAAPHRERMAFLFSDTTDSGTRLDLWWEKLVVSVPIATKTPEIVAKGISKYGSGSARTLAGIARWLAENPKRYDEALRFATASLALDEGSWFGHWVAAFILGEKKDFAGARTHGQKAWDLGLKAGSRFFYKDRVKKALEDWKKK